MTGPFFRIKRKKKVELPEPDHKPVVFKELFDLTWTEAQKLEYYNRLAGRQDD